MKVIKSKSNKTSQKIHSLLKPSAVNTSVDRVLVVYGEQDASIYYEAPQPKPVARAG